MGIGPTYDYWLQALREGGGATDGLTPLVDMLETVT